MDAPAVLLRDAPAEVRDFDVFPPSSFFARFGIPNLSESSASGRTESGFGVSADAAANVAKTIAAIAALLRVEFKNFIFYMVYLSL